MARNVTKQRQRLALMEATCVVTNVLRLMAGVNLSGTYQDINYFLQQ